MPAHNLLLYCHCCRHLVVSVALEQGPFQRAPGRLLPQKLSTLIIIAALFAVIFLTRSSIKRGRSGNRHWAYLVLSRPVASCGGWEYSGNLHIQDLSTFKIYNLISFVFNPRFQARSKDLIFPFRRWVYAASFLKLLTYVMLTIYIRSSRRAFLPYPSRRFQLCAVCTDNGDKNWIDLSARLAAKSA